MQSPTLGVYLEEWLGRRRMDLRPSSAEGYGKIVSYYLLPHLGEVRLDRLDRRRIEGVLAVLLDRGGRREQGLSPRTVVQIHAVLHRALKDAVLDGLIDDNPAHGARTPRRDPAAVDVDDPPQVWTATEVACFLAFVEGHRLRPVWHLAIATGMRRGELLGLRWVDVDLDRRQLTVRRSLTVADGVTRLLATKTSQTRVISIDPTTTELLAEHRRTQERQRRSTEAWQDQWGLVFTSAVGAPLSPGAVSQAFRRVVRRAPVHAIRMHDLRHSHASLLLQAGVPVKVASARLGHAKASMTLDVYAHVLPAADKDAARLFQHVIAEPDGGSGEDAGPGPAA